MLIIDDLVKDAEEAMSSAALDKHWRYFKAIVQGRLGPRAPIVVVGTRWARKDVFGRIMREEEESPPHLKDNWKVIKLKAIAETDDVLGRKPGEALWPEEVPLKKHLQAERTAHRWFRATGQQEPEEEKGLWFQPFDANGKLVWPVYKDIGDAYSLDVPGERRRVWMKGECIVIVTMDWAWGKKTTSDFTAVGAYAITPLAQALVLEVKNERWRPEELAPELEKFCIRHAPSLVAVEAGHPTLAHEYGRFRGIPEIRWLTTRGRNKLSRSLQSITMSQNGKVFVPEGLPPWVQPFLSSLAAFTGDEKADDHDDQVDQLSYCCILTQQMRGQAFRPGWEPEVLIPGREQW